jgi:hypothetical protein
LTVRGLWPYIVDTYKRYEGKEKSQTDKSRREWQKEELEVQSFFLLSTPFEQTSMSPTALGCEGEAPINSQPQACKIRNISSFRRSESGSAKEAI